MYGDSQNRTDILSLEGRSNNHYTISPSIILIFLINIKYYIILYIYRYYVYYYSYTKYKF